MRQLVSIIIPAYNVEKYITEAVDSALAQTCKNIEVIVVDDGSTDGTKKVLSSYVGKNQIRYIYQSNKGLSGARNTGMRAAKGEYIAFLDADDIFLPDKVQRQIDYLKLHPECDVCYCDIWHFYDEEPQKMFKLNYDYHSRESVFRKLLLKNFINPLSVVIRKATAEKYGYFNEDMRRSEDWDYWVNLAWQGARFCFLAEILAKYRIRKGSLSYSWSSEIQRKETSLDIFRRLKNKMTAEERFRYGIYPIILFHWLKLQYAKIADRFFPLRKIHYFIQSRRLRSFSEDSLISKIRLFLKNYPRLRYLIRYARWQMKRVPLVGNLIINLERSFVFSYAEERYTPESPFSDGTDFHKRAKIILPLVRGNVLDLGCGYGYLTELMAEKEEVRSVIGIDKIKDFRRFHSKIKFISADITKLKKLEGKFDFVVAAEFIEHIEEYNLEKLLFLVQKLLVPDGLFIGTTPDGQIQSNWPFHFHEYTRPELEIRLKKHFNNVIVKNMDFSNLFFRAENLRGRN